MEITCCVDYINLPEGRPVLSTARLSQCSGNCSVAHFVPPHFFLSDANPLTIYKEQGKHSLMSTFTQIAAI